MGQLAVPPSTSHVVIGSIGSFGFCDGTTFTLWPRALLLAPEQHKWREGSATGKKSWNVASGQSTLVSVALSPDGSTLATRSWDNPEIHLWDTTTQKRRYVLSQRHGPKRGTTFVVAESTGVVAPDLVFSPDGRFLAGAGPNMQLCVWDLSSGTLLWEQAPPAGQAIERFTFSPDSRCLACVHADHRLTLCEVLTGAKRVVLGKADPKNRRVHLTNTTYNGTLVLQETRRDVPVCLAFSPNGRFLAMAKDTPEIHLWDIRAGQDVQVLKGPEGGVVSLLFTPDGKHLISGGTDTTAMTWDLTGVLPTQRGSADAEVELGPQMVNALWTDLVGKDATRAFSAIRMLCTSPDQAVALIKERVRPAALPNPKRLARLLADLQSDSFELRREADSNLEILGDLAEPALRKVLEEDPPVHLRRRVERLLAKMLLPTTQQMGERRAVELLEAVGSSNARQVLRSLASGATGTGLTREAQSALQRLTNLAVTP
jgi:hypothetical protein